MATLWTENFPYPDGSLTGDGGWVAFGALDPLTVAGNAATVIVGGAGNFQGNQIDLTPFGFNPLAPWSVSFSLTHIGPGINLGISEFFTYIGSAANRVYVRLAFSAGDAALNRVGTFFISWENGLSATASNVPFPASAANIVTLAYDGVNVNGSVNGVQYATFANALTLVASNLQTRGRDFSGTSGFSLDNMVLTVPDSAGPFSSKLFGEDTWNLMARRS